MKKTRAIRHQLFLLLIIFWVQLSSQNTKHTISGYVYEKGSKENLPGANIYIPKLKVGTVTNNYGFYSITLPADTFEILVSYIGFTPQAFKLKLNSKIQLDISLESVAQLDEVEITAKSPERISEEVQMSKIDLPVEQIKSLPALLGEKDVLKAIQLLPGVQKGSEGSSGIYVRGGGPDQNLIILDDATVYNATHLFGFFSLFNGDALKSVELTKGGFPAKYGGRLSSVIEMQMKDGDKQKIKGEVGIGLISSRLTLEGPLKKDKTSFLVSARRTYIDVLARPFIRNSGGGGNGVNGYYFYDFNAKLNHIINYKNKLYLSGYFGQDKFYSRSSTEYEKIIQKSEANLQWGNATGTLRWNHLINEKMFSNVSFIFSDFKFKTGVKESAGKESFELNYSSGIQDYSIKGDIDLFPNARHSIKTGILATYHQFMPSALVSKTSNTTSLNRNVKIESYETAMYVQDDYKINQRWRLNAGFRVSNFNVRKTSYFNFEPRFSARYLIRKDISFKASYASMNQYLHLLSNSGIGLPTDLWVPATDRVKPQQSRQLALGIAKDLKIVKADFLVSLEGYYKTSKNIIGYKEGASFLNAVNLDPNSTTKFTYEDIVTSGKAESYGAEFFFQKKVGKLTGWIGYTLSWTWLTFNELNFGKRFPARYDRRHDISIVGIYKINDRISLSSVWVYGTGNAITLPLSTYKAVDYTSQLQGFTPSASAIKHGYTNILDFINTTTVNDYGDRNSFRMAPYHRLDIAIQFHKKRKKYERIFELGVYNAYNRRNPFYYKTETNPDTRVSKLKQVSLFPIIPSFTWTWKF